LNFYLIFPQKLLFPLRRVTLFTSKPSQAKTGGFFSMTEREKMAAGELYHPDADPTLSADRARCKDLCQVFNQTRFSDAAGQEQLLRLIFGHVHGKCFITAPFWCDYGYNIELGDGFYANHNCVILDGARVTVGKNVLLGPNCCLTTAGHAMDPDRRRAGLETAQPIVIGDNVWLGAGVTVLPGVTIGENSVIGAGSIVNRDIPANVVAAGNPCRVIREL
jgi:galactoside O-acetyltransferase